MKQTLIAILSVLVAAAIFAFGFRMGRLYGSNPMRVEYDPVVAYNREHVKVELIQVRLPRDNKLVCMTDTKVFPAREDNNCYLADVGLGLMTH